MPTSQVLTALYMGGALMPRPGLFHVAGRSCPGLTVGHDKLLLTRLTWFCPRQDSNKRAMACIMMIQNQSQISNVTTG